MRLNAIFGCGAAVFAWMMAGALPCRAQYPEDFHPYVLDVAAGLTGVGGSDQQNFGSFAIYQAGGGIALTSTKPKVQYDQGKDPKVRHWNYFLKGDFLYGQADLKGSAVQQIINSNPQTPSLLPSSSGKGKFYSTTLGPRAQYSSRWISVYGQAGFGWLRRSIDLTGVSTEGSVLQPNNPSVFSQSGNSGAFRGTVGVSAGAKGFRAFGEVGLLQGFAINHGTLLAPMISGGVRW